MAKKIEEVTATGRRKRAVAAVRLRKGTGKIEVNHRPFEEYFSLQLDQKRALLPMRALDLHGRYDLVVRVKGGGISGQADALLLGIARALVKENEERRKDLKALGYLRRDARKRERKKYGLKGARKSFQFSKR